MEKTYTNLKKLSEKHNEAEYQAEIPVAVLEKYISREIAHAGQDYEMPGFRRGKVPEHILREKLDEMELLENAAENALRIAVREIIEDGGVPEKTDKAEHNHLSILGSPRLTITKIAPKNPVEFKVMFALYPEVTLPDYKKIGNEIAARKDAVEVTDEEIAKAIEQLMTMIGGATTPDEEIVKAATGDTDENDGAATTRGAPTPATPRAGWAPSAATHRDLCRP